MKNYKAAKHHTKWSPKHQKWAKEIILGIRQENNIKKSIQSRFLTKKQKETLNFIKDFYHKKGYTPTYCEIGKALKLSSTSSPYARVQYLIDKGYLIRQGNVPNSLILVSEIDVLQFVKTFKPKLFNGETGLKDLKNILLKYKKQL